MQTEHRRDGSNKCFKLRDENTGNSSTSSVNDSSLPLEDEQWNNTMGCSACWIGFAVARRLAQQGAHVVLSSRKQENVDKAIEKLRTENLRVSGAICDVGKKEDRESLVEMLCGKAFPHLYHGSSEVYPPMASLKPNKVFNRFSAKDPSDASKILKAVEKHGGIDYLFSNAANEVTIGDVLNTTEEEWNETLHINVTVMFLMVQQVVPHMLTRGGGSIVLTSSVTGYSHLPTAGPYCVSKTAINGLTKVLAPDLYSKNIRLNSIAPGVIKTTFSTPLWEEESTLETFKQIYGFSRLGAPEECAGIVSYLLSSDASYVIGETVVVGGGFRSRI